MVPPPERGQEVETYNLLVMAQNTFEGKKSFILSMGHVHIASYKKISVSAIWQLVLAFMMHLSHLAVYVSSACQFFSCVKCILINLLAVW